MALIGLLDVIIVTAILWVRSNHPLNKAGIAVLAAIATLYTAGVMPFA